jgi:hypothetical protein
MIQLKCKMMSMVSGHLSVVRTLRWAKREQLPVLSYGFPPAQRDFYPVQCVAY